MRDDKAGAALHQTDQSFLNVRFGQAVDAGRRFVQNQDARIRQDGAGNAEQLPFSLGEIVAAFGQHRVVAVRQS